MELDVQRLSQIDLNGLLTLLVVYRECCVSKAARCLQLKQPAVSNTLARLRVQFNDPLFVRHSRGVTPTHKTLEIVDQLGPAFALIQNILPLPQAIAATRSGNA